MSICCFYMRILLIYACYLEPCRSIYDLDLQPSNSKSTLCPTHSQPYSQRSGRPCHGHGHGGRASAACTGPLGLYSDSESESLCAAPATLRAVSPTRTSTQTLL